MKLPSITIPNHMANASEFEKLTKAAQKPAREDRPEALAIREIKELPNLFQPRLDTIGFAPGRSEAHIAKMAKIAKGGRPLDPVTVVAFGDAWYLVDGHHRLQAYSQAGWQEAVPVKVAVSDLVGASRVEWAIGLSVADNLKEKLGLSDTEKMNRAWQAVARDVDASKGDLAALYGVAERSIANMRAAKRRLEEADKDTDYIPTWASAKAALRALDENGDEGHVADWDSQKLRALAKRLRPVMDLRAPPRLLLEALEAYDPFILDTLVLAKEARQAEEDDFDDI